MLQWVFERYHKATRDGSGLKPMILVVFISSFYCNKDLTAQVLHTLLGQPAGNPLDWLYAQILEQYKSFEGIHDRKMAIFAITAALQLSPELRPSPIVQSPNEVTKKLVYLFDTLQKAIKAAADMRLDDSEDGDSDTESDASGDVGKRNIDQDLGDSEDEIDEAQLEYLEQLSKAGRTDVHLKEYFGDNLDNSDDDDEDYDDRCFVEETDAEAYTNNLDDESKFNVFVSFKTVFEGLQSSDPTMFTNMTTGLNEQEMADLHKLITVCCQNEQAEKSKQVAQAGGYAFSANAAVPGSFNFGGAQ
uniref:Importin-7 n=1 Tax=Steinernema glaseri TaxID=37863 RepID=A0A1I8A622_9BILA